MKKFMKIMGIAVAFVATFFGGMVALRKLQLKYPMTEDAEDSDE